MAVKSSELYQEIIPDHEVRLLTTDCFGKKIEWVHMVENIVKGVRREAVQHDADSFGNGTGNIRLCNNAFVACEINTAVICLYILAACSLYLEGQCLFKPEVAGRSKIVCHILPLKTNVGAATCRPSHY